MQETKDPKASTGTEHGAQGGGTPKRDEEATSSETLSDIEESTKVKGGGGSGSGSGSGGGSLEGSTPAPDAGGSGGGRADGSDTGGPM